MFENNNKVHIVYYSSATENTKRFIEKLGFKNTRVPISMEDQSPLVNYKYVLICPTYSGGGEFTKGAVPKTVIKFLNIKNNRDLCCGIIATGNVNFNDTFCLAGSVLSKKLNLPVLFKLELSGTESDVKKTKQILNNYWNEKKEKYEKK